MTATAAPIDRPDVHLAEPPAGARPGDPDAPAIRFFRVLNRFLMVPATRAGLGAWLSTPVGGAMVLLRIRGRKSGLIRETPLNYIVAEGAVWVVAGFGPRTEWYRNLLADPRVEAVLPGRTLTGTVTDVRSPAVRRRILPAVMRSTVGPSLAAGVNPWRETPDSLSATMAWVPLLRIDPDDGPVEAGPDDPGGTAWIWRQALVLGLSVGGARGGATRDSATPRLTRHRPGRPSARTPRAVRTQSQAVCTVGLPARSTSPGARLSVHKDTLRRFSPARRPSTRHNGAMPTFDERAPDWDTTERTERALAVARLILETARPDPGARVLELGAGTGLLGLALLPHVGSVVLADASGGMLDTAEAKIATGAHPGARTLRLALTRDPLPDERFDLVVSLMALHHVPDTAAAMAGLAALLEPGGRIAIVDLEAEDGSFHSDPSEAVLAGFDRDDLRSVAVQAGFRDVAFRPAWEMTKNDRAYPLFLLTATRT